MAVNFPSNPTNGQTITASGITYAYDSTQGVWSDSPQGLTQAIDALTDVDTSTSAPTNGQTLQWNSTDSEWQPADSSAGVTVYATIDDLPLSGVVEGSMALVDSTDKLYIFSDAGWYSISIVNTTPSISGVSATYTLATDGTATVVTVTATDPEGIPITYSIVSDTSGNIATVAQGTGSNTNQWTITPSTNTANGGTFSLTFRASDGVNIATASSTFSLAFVLTIPDSKYTTALITSVGANNAVNNSFDDASTNNHTITANGNVTQGTFSPYRHSGYSTYFDGSGDSLSIADNAAFNFGSGDSTIEMWVYPLGSGTFNLITRGTSNFSGFILSGTGLLDSTTGSSWNVNITFSTAITANSWQHVAVVRNGSTITVYRNGTSIGTSSISGSVVSAAQSLTIGQRAGQSDFSGYMTDLRIVKGTAVYTSAFIPPTERLTAVTNTSLLTCHLPYIADGSTNNHSLTVNGNTKTEPFSPYDHNGYSLGDHGGSMYFDGTGDYLTAAGTTIFDIASSTASFTVEAWIYPTSFVSGAFAYRFAEIISKGAVYVGFGYASDGTLRFYTYSGSQNYANSSAGAIKLNTWTHVAVVCNAGSLTLYVNGVADGTGTLVAPQSPGVGVAPKIGTADTSYSSDFVNGFISNLRVVDGTAVYTSAFTPPTAPLTAVTNTSLLINGTDAGIIDQSQSVKTVLLNGGAKSSTTQTKYLTSSMYLDGGAYIKSDAGAELYGYTGAFTIEAWIYPTSISQYSNPIFNYGNSGSTGNDHFNFELGGGGILQVRWNQAYPVSASQASSTPLNTWTHVALTRDSSNNLKLWVGGTLADSATQSGGLPTAGANRTIIGSQSYSEGNANRSFNGYISDLRVTKGLARYTSNFTIPSAALEG